MSVGCDACGFAGYHKVARGEMAAAELCNCVKACSICGGSGSVSKVIDGYRDSVPCECAPVRRAAHLYNQAQIPARYRDKEIGAYVHHGGNQSRIKTLLAQYLEDFQPDKPARGLLITGRPGTGKTHLICALLGYLTLEDHVACRYVDFFHLIERLKGTFNKKTSWDGREEIETQESIIEPLVNVPVLAIDELGKGKGHATPWELSIVDQLISRRYNAGRVVIATSNFKPSAASPDVDAASEYAVAAPAGSLDEKVGVRIVSRLRETCDFHHIEGPDYRGR